MTREPGPLIGEAGSLGSAAARLRDWGLTGPRPVLAVVGGAAGMGPESLAAVRVLLADHVLPRLARLDAVVVDGGTRSGVMRLLGETVGELPVPLLGVAVAGTVRIPGRPDARDDAADLEPHHRAVLLVDGTDWGDEAPWISAVAGLVAGSAPSATLLVNGGEVAYEDVRHSVDAGRPVIVVDGSGRTADRIANPRGSGDPRALFLADSALVHVVDIDAPGPLTDLIAALLT